MFTNTTIGTSAQLHNAQLAYDNRAEPQPSESSADLQAWAEHLTVLANEALEQIGRAERALATGNYSAAQDMLSCAALQLGDLQ
jgi:hypothetical protein